MRGHLKFPLGTSMGQAIKFKERNQEERVSADDASQGQG